MSTQSSLSLCRLHIFSEGFISNLLAYEIKQSGNLDFISVCMTCPFEEQGVYSLGFKSLIQNRILLPSDQHQQMLLAGFPKLLNICCSCWFQRAVQKLSKSSASLNVRLAAWHPEISCGTGRSTVGLMLAWDQLFHMWEERSTHALWPNRQLMEEMQQWHKKCGASWGNHHSSKHNEHLLATYMATCVMH